MYSTVLRHILYPLRERILGTTMLKYLKELEESRWWSLEQIGESYLSDVSGSLLRDG